MNSYLRYLITSGIVPIALTCSTAKGQPGLLDLVKTPPMPANLQVPAGNIGFLKTRATGTQNYVCRTSETGYAWTLFGPQATLFLPLKWFQTDISQQIMTHFLSANPVEAGTPRPTWQSSLDTSAVWGKAAATSNDRAYVAAGAIPWLLVEVVGTRPGPTGGTTLIPTTYIQRLNTSGGVAPATGCSQAANLGSTVLVPYTTDYYFYRATGTN